MRKPDLIDRMHALVCIANAIPHNHELSAFGFLSLIHPDIPLERRLKIAHEIKYGQEKTGVTR